MTSILSSSLEILRGPYDPHDHRVVLKPTNYFETLMHLLKCSIGTGILAMPQAFARAGLITATISTVIIGVIITHCLQILIKSQYVVCKAEKVALMSYPLSTKAALKIGPKCTRNCAGAAPGLVNLFNAIFQLGICCVYILFIAKSMKQMLDPYFNMHVMLHMLTFLLPLIAMNCIRHLKALAPFSTAANVFILITLLVIIGLLLTQSPLDGELDLWGSFVSFPLFFGTMLFGLTAVGVVIALENNTQKPKDFVKPFGVLNVGMSIVVLAYVAMGVIGHLFCRTKCADSITLNLDANNIWMRVTMPLFVMAIFISYVLQCYVPVEIIWGYVRPCLERRGSQRLLFWEYVVRVLIVLFTFAVAMLVPMLGLIISLSGALCLSILGMIFPALMEICVISPNYGPCKIKLIKNIFLIILGFIGLFVGTFFSVKAMVDTFREGL